MMEPTALLSSIKTVIDITKSIGNLAKDKSPLDSKIRELTQAVIDAQSHILAMNAEYHKALQDNHEISQKLMEFENWEKERAKYKLIEISKGVLVYAFDSSRDPSIPEHYICKNCYNDKIASILDPVYMHSEGSRYSCPRCKTEFSTHVDAPDQTHADSDYDL